MTRIEPNLLLALTTGVAVALLVTTAAVFGEPGRALKYLVLAVVVPVSYVVLNGLWSRRMKLQRPPMVHAEAATTAVWASLFPLLVILAAGVPLVFPGHDYGLLVIIAAVWLGVTVESALKARQAG
ncbi:hypothetical protein [Brevundimonas sp.]|uniref:hypothetical protein n=1 Tax=Brevundimonas sp. TaxID=1871086 RepID=UPI00248A8BBC|nr:hypothetical protein [Brevundimonas sp.]MDI1280762.1 hypothetical protein [Brevundimonas sp.]